MMTKWGEPIRVDGVRPDWLRDECGLFENSTNSWYGDEITPLNNWHWAAIPGRYGCPIHIRLPADHPYYKVQRYNAKHGTNFTYWPGGESAPNDWDGGEVLLDDPVGPMGTPKEESWAVSIGPFRPIIGYNRVPTIDNLKIDKFGHSLHTDPEPDRFANESPIRAFTDWQVSGNYALGKGFRPSLAHLVVYLDAMQTKENWQLVQILEADTQTPSFVFRRAYP